jgi:hypothetical protein
MQAFLLFLGIIFCPKSNDSIVWHKLALSDNKISVNMPAEVKSDSARTEYLPAKNQYIANVDNIYFEFNYWENDTSIFQRCSMLNTSQKVIKQNGYITKWIYSEGNVIRYNNCLIVEYKYLRTYRKGLHCEKEKGIDRYYKINNTIYKFSISYNPQKAKVKEAELFKLKNIFFNSLEIKL